MLDLKDAVEEGGAAIRELPCPASASKVLTKMTMGLSVQILPDSNQSLEAILNASDDLLFILDRDGTILEYKAGKGATWPQPPEKLIGQKLQEILPPEVSQKFGAALRKVHRASRLLSIEYSLPTPSGEHWYESRLVPFSNGQSIMVVRDITKYKQAEIKIQRQYDQLAALRAIDLAITSGVDINLTLSIILSHVTAQLKMDAASILLLDPNTQTLNFTAGLGFKTSDLQQIRLRIGSSYAGRAVLERSTVHIADLHNRQTDFLRSPVFHKESFVSYYAVPLIAKGLVLGVLEIFRRAPVQPDSEWLTFMNMLAGQAAIAIDNAMLYKNLQRTNIDLTLAYDKTIEGWSRALDLRDKETEGHTKRVTEMTLRLASRLGISEGDRVHIRRGAILHDIGKVAIPDSILLKPGPLSEDEWLLMRQHPLIAVDLLTPISYLTQALAIPRSHHEKWDGSGYPDGLFKDRIPLPARLFAVVDVYDALTSDRPYRPAWSEAEALEHIRSQAGRYFDPSIIPVFFYMISELKHNSRDKEFEQR